MAGDWIPMRLDLADDPAVMAMAELLGMPEPCVVGYLHTIWSWASRHCNDGSVTQVTPEALGRVTRCAKVPEAMLRVGWLECGEIDGKPVITFPNWARWLSQSAKSRVLTSRRVAQHRQEKCNGVSVTESLPEKRREKKSKKESKPKKSASTFVKPSLEEITEYIQAQGYAVDAQLWLDHYEANGWRVGRNPMRDWQAAVRTWAKNEFGAGKGNGKGGSGPMPPDEYQRERERRLAKTKALLEESRK
jgi:hypothetical protein